MILFPKLLLLCIVLIKILEATSTIKRPIIFPDANGNYNINGYNLPGQTSWSPMEGKRNGINLPGSTSWSPMEGKHILTDRRHESEANHLSSIRDFATFYNFNLPKIDPFRRSSSIFNRVSFRVANSQVYELEQATCKPELQTVHLDLPKEEGIDYFPSCVRIERCGGCCLFSHQSCQPTDTRTIKVKAVKVKKVVTTNRRSGSKHAKSDYISVDVEEHLTCDCKCKLMENDCNSAIHFHSKHDCACKCKDKDKQQTCLESRDHIWNYDKCECFCRKEIICSTGKKFDHETCSCVDFNKDFNYDIDYINYNNLEN